MFEGFDFIGLTRAIDQAIYMLLNTVATMLWRLDAAMVSMSLYAYSTQDWLTGSGSGGGVWWVLDWLIVNPGLFGLNTWTLFAGLAPMLWGLSHIVRPFFNTSPVHPGKLLLFFILSFVVIDQGSELMQGLEAWRMQVGSAVYEAVSGSGDTSGISVPTIPSTSDPQGAPADLDGSGVIRGWEAVSSSYFLVTNMDELHQAYPPQNFRIAYCLYNPELPISGQNVVNAEGCSPRLAWDEWETVDIQILEELLGLDVDAITDPVEEFFDWFGITIEIGDNIANIPLTQHHPANRELAIRQSAAGISWLGLGVIVALFPLLEANIALMLALAASFIYISLPVVILFGFFLPTEGMVTNPLMQFVNVVIRTIVIMDIVAVFMLILMDSALSGTIMSYLGLIGVGLVGGWFLQRMAAATMKEAMSGAMSAVDGVWMGTATGLLRQLAGRTAATTLGAAKVAGAILAGAGAMKMLDLSEAAYEGVRAGEQNIRRGVPETMGYLDQRAGQMHPALAKMAATRANGQPEESLLIDRAAGATLAVVGLAGTVEEGGAGQSSNGKPPAPRWGADRAGVATLGTTLAATGPDTSRQENRAAAQQRQTGVDGWIAQTYAAQQSQRGRDLVGEALAWKAERALSRRSPQETGAVLTAARQAEDKLGHARMVRRGRLTTAGLRAVRRELDPETAQAFRGQQGLWDLAALTAVGVQQETTVSPDEFRRQLAQAESGWGQESPGHQVPRALGLDPVAAGAHYTALNRFARLSDAAGLSVAQRERLLAEVRTDDVSPELRVEIDTALQSRDSGATTEELVSSAQALPATLTGPEQVWTTPAQPGRVEREPDQPAEKTATGIVTPDDDHSRPVPAASGAIPLSNAPVAEEKESRPAKLAPELKSSGKAAESKADVPADKHDQAVPRAGGTAPLPSQHPKHRR